MTFLAVSNIGILNGVLNSKFWNKQEEKLLEQHLHLLFSFLSSSAVTLFDRHMIEAKKSRWLHYFSKAQYQTRSCQSEASMPYHKYVVKPKSRHLVSLHFTAACWIPLDDILATFTHIWHSYPLQWNRPAALSISKALPFSFFPVKIQQLIKHSILLRIRRDIAAGIYRWRSVFRGYIVVLVNIMPRWIQNADAQFFTYSFSFNIYTIF